DVKASMNGLNANALPEGVLAFWDFEADPAADHGFIASGAKKGAKAYIYERETKQGEGQSVVVPVAPAYSVGCPFISGSAYKVETLPTWTAKRATVIESEGNSTEGHATLSWKAEGDYNVTLTLANNHGSDSRTFPVFTVKDQSGLTETIAGADAQAYTVDGTLMVEVDGNEAYTVSVANTAGQIVASRSVAAGAERMMRIDLRSAGVYVVTVTTDGGATRTFKLLSK
ncbi:MAG: T9SS type A sorting domain-containing protein, partial [Muribaculaceae bacterium]|nr:T9SS type A sorting domain-containing protein [Muribaculaceae bacterium]